MKKVFALSIVMMLCILAGHAQKRKHERFEFAMGLEAPFGVKELPTLKNILIPGVYYEGRWQLNKVPIDLGFHFGISVVQRVKQDVDYRDRAFYVSAPLMAIVDYQFCRGRLINPYVGIGIGVAINGMVRYHDDIIMDELDAFKDVTGLHNSKGNTSLSQLHDAWDKIDDLPDLPTTPAMAIKQVLDYKIHRPSFVFSPRAGIRLFRIFDIGVGYIAKGNTEYSRWYANVGIYFYR
jgi:hypothetical protein